jgi:hypothetical protein
MTTLYSKKADFVVIAMSGRTYFNHCLYFRPKGDYTLPEVEAKIKEKIEEKKNEIFKELERRFKVKVLNMIVKDYPVEEAHEVEHEDFIEANGVLLKKAIIFEI